MEGINDNSSVEAVPFNSDDESTSGASAPRTAASATASGAPAAAPAAVAPSAQGATATAPNAAPAAAVQPAVAAAGKKQEGMLPHMLHGILGALGGTDETVLTRDKSGNLVKSTIAAGPGTQWKRIIAGALSGAAAGAGVGRGPASKGRAAAAGFAAGQKQADDENSQPDKAIEADQKAILAKAQIAMLNQQVTAATFSNSRNKITAAYDDSQRENSLMQSIKAGGGNSTDLGVAKSLDDVMAMHKDMPTLLQEQAHGNIIGVPHVNENGQYDGMHYALVTPEWKSAKLDHDEKFRVMVPPKKLGDNPTVEWQTVKAGTMTNGEFQTASMASDKDIVSHSQEIFKQQEETKRNAATNEAHIKGSQITADSHVAAAKIGDEKATRKETEGKVKELNKAYIQPAEQVEKSYRMMDGAYREFLAARKAGKTLPTGAQSMLALSSHLQTTFGQVKGARVTKDMIAHHLGARDISDDARVAFQKLQDGDVLSPNQWQAFHHLVGQSRQLSWEIAAKEARRAGVPVDFLPNDLKSLAAPEGATDEIYAADGKTLIGHNVNGKYVPLGKEGK